MPGSGGGMCGYFLLPPTVVNYCSPVCYIIYFYSAGIDSGSRYFQIGILIILLSGWIVARSEDVMMKEAGPMLDP